MTLFELNQACKEALENCIDPETGEVTDFSALEALEEEKAEKVKNCALYYLNMLAEVKALEELEKKYKQRKQALKNKADRFKSYIEANTDEAYTFPEVEIYFTKSTETVITDQEAFERYCKRHKNLCTVEVKPNKTAIKQAIAQGENVKGAELVTKHNIQVR